MVMKKPFGELSVCIYVVNNRDMKNPFGDILSICICNRGIGKSDRDTIYFCLKVLYIYIYMMEIGPDRWNGCENEVHVW